jgi:hypothetical protein
VCMKAHAHVLLLYVYYLLLLLYTALLRTPGSLDTKLTASTSSLLPHST